MNSEFRYDDLLLLGGGLPLSSADHVQLFFAERAFLYMLGMRLTYARTLFEPVTQGLAPTISDLQEARDILEDVVRRTRRVFGTGHPDYPSREKRLQMVEVFLAANLKIAAGDPEGGIAMAREAFG